MEIIGNHVRKKRILILERHRDAFDISSKSNAHGTLYRQYDALVMRPF